MTEQTAFRQRQLTALPEPPELPFPPAAGRDDAASAVAALPGRPAEPLVTALAGLFALLHRWTGRRDLLAETPTGRADPAGWLPVRVRLPEDPTWAELRDLVRAAVRNSRTNEADLTGPAPDCRPVASLGADPLPPDARGTLLLRLADADGRPAVTVVHPHAARVAAGLTVLLARADERPGTRLSDLPLLDEATDRRVRVEWNASDTGYPRNRSVPELFAEWVGRTPDAPALRDGDQVLSYREVDRRANRVAHHLRRLGLGGESLVGICLADTTSWVVAALATLKAGAAYLPLDPGYPRERLALMCADAAPGVILHAAALADRLPDDGTPRVALDRLDDGPAEPLELTVHPDQLAYVMYTSGSTGQPKGTGVSHRNIVRLVCDTNFVAVRPDDVMGQAATMSFDAATLEVWGALLNGACLADLDINDVIVPDRLRERLRATGVTMMFLATSVARQLAMEAPDAVAGLRYLTFGGEQADRVAVGRLRDACPDTTLVNGYGPTEGTTYTTTYDCARLIDADPVVPIGGPVANTRVYVLDRLLQPVPPGVLGELFIGGDGVARGYLGRPGATAEKFVPDPFASRPGGRLYRTGDLVRQRADGLIEFVGRADHQVKIRGYRVEPGEVTEVLRRGGLLRDAIVRADRDAAGDGRLVAYVVPDDGVTVEAVRARVREQLPDHLVPAVFVPLPALPLNRNGKVDLSALPAPDDAPTAVEDAGPRTPTERAVAEIWQDVLGVPVRRRGDDFFDLGGRSLKATRVRSRLSAAIGTEVPLRLVFDHPTVAALAAAADEIAGARGGPVAPAGRTPDTAPDGRPATDLAGLLDQLEHGAGAR
ncbi:non-ribosomal peptide synthetase [Micromonospora sp. 4G57]|uniref:Non-ribosomal peptide synthetase n=1 Tax=Micromonospora sicca TaxID=2202420 RepID=A0ABU5J6V7_9ACTN|nr:MULTISPECIES: non-ribosomal peptide synthetase [unclassified Micromonospora]MDZ5443025.1 non-ribosomal peptide synthetase [Micromonospora sp. 4G57]MDZ5488263.1 non-ribosomal peptide synthetase [Micromonospora sp. 4G53]